MPCFRSRTRSDSGVREKGAVLVEAAIVIPVLIIILLGIIDFGFAFNSYISLRQGTRETGRQMVVNKAVVRRGQVFVNAV